MKIRLAKHTRALAAALAFCVLSAVPAYAQEDDTVEVPGVPVTLSLPAGSLILTRETPVDDAIFETLNVDGAAILENMNKNDLYLDAVLFKPPLEFTLVRCCFSKRMRNFFRKNEKSVLQFCNKKPKRKGRLQRVEKSL